MNKYMRCIENFFNQTENLWSLSLILQEYNLADFQCFSRYLDMFGDIKVDEVTDVDVFKSTYFPRGFNADNSGYTVSNGFDSL